ncbi:MAG: hypothetical protein M3306_11755 [Actinomycetota bacterium]|nr:hypothetical protein [Actinomycetota bacterium]
MSDVLHAGAVVSAAFGACCVARNGGRLGDLSAAVVMVLAMLDMALGSLVLSTAGWTLVLLGTAGALEIGHRVGVTEKCRHSVVGTALIGACTAVLEARRHVHAMEAGDHHVGNLHGFGHDMVGSALLAIAVIGTLAYLPMTWCEMRSRPDTPAQQLAAGSMAASLVLMLLAATV